MIRVCRGKFPHLQFIVADASDLSQLADATFDAIVFSFNGIDCLVPEESRHKCLRECHRVLKPAGVYIFSSHNPRSLFIDWQWDQDRLRRLANKVAAGGVVFHAALSALNFGRVMLGAARAFVKAIPRARRRLPMAAFWRGHGYIFDPAHGGLTMHYALPQQVVAELTRFGFKLLRTLPEDYPRKSHQYSTRWYYYAFSKHRA